MRNQQFKRHRLASEKPLGEDGRCIGGRESDIARNEDLFRSTRTNSVQLINIQPYEISISCQPIPFGYMSKSNVGPPPDANVGVSM